MNSPAPQTEAANEARRQSTEAMLERIQTALRHMRRDRIPITKAAVARHADVSRSFIYQNDRARVLIANAAESTARARSDDRAEQAAEAEQAWKDRALNAEAGLKTAYAEISAQRSQIGQLLARIRDFETDLPSEAHGRVVAENTTLKQKFRQLTSENRTLTDRLQAARSNARFADKRISELEMLLLDSGVVLDGHP
ncbi:DUF6262 family protein [Streptomyces sp. Rer75]|uniref:DUF6262 family protein n=1 Tax=Streptomyces sp. Rer75 TaxID=2750011 RepID=UPI0015CFC5E7|nr:DUF6262 family protein [Streptomyces sp. Rer75]QLH24403.1 hypothetical protein HYQ63_30315 [Streptomyces sp. Rer75]